MPRLRTLEELEAQAAKNGYQRGAHEEDDKKKGVANHGKGTIEDHDRTLHRYMQ